MSKKDIQPEAPVEQLAIANTPDEKQIEAIVDQMKSDLDLEQQKNAALEAEVERLTNLVADMQKEAEAYQAQLQKARTKPGKETPASSVVFETQPVQTAPQERPVVEIQGSKYRFTRGRFHVLGKLYLATEAAADESLCARLLLEFPQLLEAVAE